MGVLIPDFQTAFINQATLRLALRDVPSNRPQYSVLLKRVQRIIRHPSCPDLRLSGEDQKRLRRVFCRIDADPYRKQEAYLASMFRMGAVLGWNPNHTWPLREQDLPFETRLLLETCYGMIGLIWQVKYCRELALCHEDNRRLIPH